MDRAPCILISDDEPLLVSAMNREAKRLGLCVIADTSSRVLELAAEHQPDVIILDVHQLKDGRDLLSALKKDERTRELPVIMLSARDDHFTRLVCLQLGALDYEVKPFDPGFLRRVARVANEHAHHAEPITLH